MMAPWTDIVAFLRQRRTANATEPFRLAQKGIEEVAASIAEGPLESVLFGWTSMFDLCIQQTDADPGASPHLRLSPQRSGLIEFRYVDTAVGDRQWVREVLPEAAVVRLISFLDQLRWVAARPGEPRLD